MKKYVIETLVQIVIWGILLLVAEEIIIILNVKGLPIGVQILYYFGIPIIIGIIICFIKNKACFKFQKKLSKRAFSILMIRVSIVLIFLILGYTLQSINARNWLSNYLDGKYTQYIASFLGSFNIYLIISFFPLSYGVTDFLFTSKDN